MAIKTTVNTLAQFPDSHHLVVVTQKTVLAWDSSGLHSVFESQSRGILAAKESGNGLGTLAVADSHLVLLHEVQQGLEKSYRLKGAEGQIRLLHFSQDYDVLYFSTTLLNSVQRYSLRESRLLEPGPTHPSPPVVLAVSPKSHIVLSASESPPTVFLQSLTYAGAPKLFIPRVSVTAVTCAAFHPTRPNIFLLAFKDGSLGIYDTTRIIRANRLAVSDSVAEYAELKSFPRLHRVSSTAPLKPAKPTKDGTDNTLLGAVSLSITGAQFLPGSKTRAITVGADGRCNIIDFEKGVVVKSWHIKGPATALSVLPCPDRAKTATTTSKKLRKPSVTRASCPVVLIAIGRVDGKVFIYDGSGALLFERTVDSDAEKVIDVEWIAGPAPPGIGDSKCLEFQSEDIVDLDVLSRLSGLKANNAAASTKSLDLAPVIEPDQGETAFQSAEEMKEESSSSEGTFESLSTVQYTESKGQTPLDFAKPAGNGYMDLFSPVKPAPTRSSPPRPRPRITSNTFVGNEPSPLEALTQDLEPIPRLLPEVPSQLPPSSAEKLEKPKKFTVKVGQVRRGSPKKVSVKIRNGIGSVLGIPHDLLASQGAIITSPSSARSTSNSKILADIRQLDTRSRNNGARKIGSNLAVLAPYFEAQTSRAKRDSDAAATGSTRRSSTTPRVCANRRKSIGSVKGARRVRVRMRPRAQVDVADDFWMTDSDPERGCNRVDGSGRPTPSHDSVETYSMSSIDSANNEFITVPSSLYMQASSTSSASTITRESSKATKPQSPKHSSSSDPASTSNAPSTDYISAQSTSPEAPPTPPLPPGFAESYQGPVDVAHYLPRRESLKFTSNSPPPCATPPKRAPMADISGNEMRAPGTCSYASPVLPRKQSSSSSAAAAKRVSYTEMHGNAIVCAGCRALCADLEMVKVEYRRDMEELRAQVEELKKAVNRKGKSLICRSLS